MALRRHDALADLMGWAMLGVGTGLTVGLFLGERLEWRRPNRRPDAPPHAPAAPASTIAHTVKAVRDAFAQHDAFHGLGLTVRALAPGVVEVGGWVDDRTTRVRVIRFARTVPGIRDVLASVLVRGEDDVHLRNHQSPTNPRS